MESHAWGGGARYVFDGPQERSPKGKAWAFMGGAAMEFTLGCNSFDAAKSVWRFRASPGALGSGVTGETERAFEEGVARVFGKAGQVVLIDASNREFARFDLRPRLNGLEVGPLNREQVEMFFSAAAIRAQTPELMLESGTNKLRSEIAGIARLACAFR